ncbi:hypothetical protein [Pseudomonas mandelii]|uniref:hypothetical protein n=1 Tax=Pseudomonas mandelii TaxID=75612 RepID=UPI00224A8F3E|nr:hypothetical protein [Pseudomonas mandelii]MCX2899611.1 hypothetical protein [Pseudomonas mandelii]
MITGQHQGLWVSTFLVLGEHDSITTKKSAAFVALDQVRHVAILVKTVLVLPTVILAGKLVQRRVVIGQGRSTRPTSHFNQPAEGVVFEGALFFVEDKVTVRVVQQINLRRIVRMIVSDLAQLRLVHVVVEIPCPVAARAECRHYDSQVVPGIEREHLFTDRLAIGINR